MSNENLKISLSAVMDNAEDELDLHRILVNADDSLMATWSRYHIARAILRKEVVYPKLNIASIVNEAIAKEESLNSLPKKIVVDKQKNRLLNFRLIMGKFAVAASVLVVTLSSVFFFNNGSPSSSFVEQVNHKSDNMAVVSNEWLEQRLSNFVDRHEQKGMLIIDSSYDQSIDSSEIMTN